MLFVDFASMWERIKRRYWFIESVQGKGGPMQMMHWYNPKKTQINEEVPAPMSDAQAIELLSGHPDSDEFIEEYRRWRATRPDVVEALIRTGLAYHLGHGRGQPPN